MDIDIGNDGKDELQSLYGWDEKSEGE